MNTNDYTIRSERLEDYREVENLVRESFWNVYRPGCSEHYVIHVLRKDPAFVKELDLVMEQAGRLIGQNMFMKTIIEADDGRGIPVLTMGPIGITPELKRKGYITVDKGSVTVNGVSLTVCEPTDDTFSVAIIPYTFENTNFCRIKEGTLVNLEFDIIGKYVSRLAAL